MVRSGTTTAHGKPVYWPGEMIERAAEAIRLCATNDTIVLAKHALMAAIRDRDVEELLERPRPQPKPRPRKTSAAIKSAPCAAVLAPAP
jgi:hypothetical protein